MSEATGLDKKAIISELTKSAHGKLDEYLTTGRQAALEDPDFFAHLVAWNHVRGQVRDAKIALPVIALSTQFALGARDLMDRSGGQLSFPYINNALAHLADMSPQLLKRVLLETMRLEKDPKDAKKKVSVTVPPFAITAKAPSRMMRRFVTRYLRDLEADRRRFEYTAVQHGHTLHELYAHYHVSRPSWVGEILFHGEKKQVKTRSQAPIFDAIHRLHLMGVEEAAGTIVKFKIPFLIARGALGKKASEPDTVLALIKAMSPTELVTNMKWLERLGVKTNPALRAALEVALGKAVTSKKAPAATLKTTRAAKALADDGDEADAGLAGKLHALQEKQLDKLGGIDGDWLVLGDRSPSMSSAMETAKQIAGILTRMVKGKVHLVLFDGSPRYFDVTGKTYDEIQQITKQMIIGSSTSIGCGLQYIVEKGIQVEGIAIISDGEHNTPPAFSTAYAQYIKKFDTEPTVYFYEVKGGVNNLAGECSRANIQLERFDLRHQNLDMYSLPNVVQTMRVSRYNLLDEILATPLRTLDEVLDKTVGMAVLPKVSNEVNV